MKGKPLQKRLYRHTAKSCGAAASLEKEVIFKKPVNGLLGDGAIEGCRRFEEGPWKNTREPQLRQGKRGKARSEVPPGLGLSTRGI